MSISEFIILFSVDSARLSSAARWYSGHHINACFPANCIIALRQWQLHQKIQPCTEIAGDNASTQQATFRKHCFLFLPLNNGNWHWLLTASFQHLCHYFHLHTTWSGLDRYFHVPVFFKGKKWLFEGTEIHWPDCPSPYVGRYSLLKCYWARQWIHVWSCIFKKKSWSWPLTSKKAKEKTFSKD